MQYDTEHADLATPSYPQSQSHHHFKTNNLDAKSTPHPSLSSSETSTSPPQPHHTQPVSRTLNLRYESLKTSAILIDDASTDKLLYRASLHTRGPQLTVSSAITSANVGAATFHTFSARIDTTAHDSPLTLAPRGVLKDGHTYVSKALGGETLMWKNSIKDDMVCTDEKGVRVARFLYGGFSIKKCGKLEMLGPKVCAEEALDEIVVTALAELMYNLKLI